MKIHTDFDLTDFNSYRIKASCKKAYFPESEQDLIDFFRLDIPYVLLGSGHNIILTKDYYDTSFIILNGNYDDVSINTDRSQIEAEAGISMLKLSKIALENDLTGLEIFYDIPSSLGGAVVMNAGASGEEIKDVIIKVRYIDLVDGLVKEINKEDILFGYRNSFFQRNTDKVVLRAWLQLRSGEKELIYKKMETIKAQRWAKQPKEFPNAGSVFKRPPGHFVGALMDELGLKGYTVGGAKISEKHGGFIVNYNNATGQDILDIIDEVKQRVWHNYKIKLEVEQRII